ncbi:Sulfur carrier protein ThiS adenylyltransferase [Anaerohalosphaera lusitana]|uniref:Sulfur carrier protein ThiS adenylyltransferase n=1 Tax=Anaerohalosphaera lusitana TaxID=1936003 RepID=A0A1U9NLB0_9BACT|nr:ThiF family adenylyltransferase [Anaerohalosphaera lusitana]AQT68721.1 Sulfur carrier protein ThiS adenylyltransferase [Anaerohalosphaera lusitana]
MNPRYSRQQDIVPAERIASCRATVIGVGAIGRQVALQLAAMGIPWLQLIDHDLIEVTNIASQGYFEADLGKPKVRATAGLCRQINSKLEVVSVEQRFKRSGEIGNCVFCAVDSIHTRRLIWQAVKDRSTFFVDGRMTAESLRVITAADESSRLHYPRTLFTPQRAYAGACTAKTTIYCANIAAGFMLAQFTKFLRQMPAEADIQLNLLAAEISVTE